jgi:DNA-binding transcriptional LysR family regulator
VDRLDAMRLFAAVADLGSFAEAARRQRVSPATATRAVALLEDQLGVTLLRRTTRSVRPTERGALYLERCRDLLRDLDEAEHAVRGQDAEPRGPLAVAAPLVFGRLHVLPIVQDLLRSHPSLSVRLTLSDRLSHLVEEEIDVAVRIGEPADSALLAIRVGEVRRVVSAAPAYLAARGIPAVPADLAVHDIVAFEGIDAPGEWRFGADENIVVQIRPRLAVNSADAAIAAAEAGLGITRTLSYQVADAIGAGRLVLVLDAFSTRPVPVLVVHPPRRVASANVAAFVRAARARLSTLPAVAPGGGLR